MLNRILLFLLVSIFLTLLPKFLRAETISLPPSIILPNYDRTLVGEYPSPEGGAYSSRAYDASANWYNPAGLMHAKKSAINASTSAYRWTGIEADTGASATGGITGGQPPSFLGVVIGSPIMGSDAVRAGFSVANETYWVPALQTQVLAPNQRLLYSVRDNFTETLPTLALAYSASESLRLGVSVAGAIVNYQSNDSISNHVDETNSQGIYTRTSQINANAMNLIGIVGAQYDATEHWVLSLVFRSPSARLFGSSKVTAEDIAITSASSRDVAFYDENGEFRYSRPLKISAGVAYVSKPFEVEANVRYHGSLGPYTLFKSSEAITTTTTSGGTNTVGNAPFNDITNEFRSVTNFAVGGKYSLSDSVDLHAGFFTSNSPIKDTSSVTFRKIDLKGITGGVSLRLNRFSGSLGGAYEFGTSDPYPIPRLDGGTSTPTSIRVTTFSVFYAFSVSF